MEFLARFGVHFLTAYHRAWVRSPAGLALGARDGEGKVVGVLLGSLDPASHYRAMLRGSGAGLAARMLGAAATRPALARELVVTRSGRYSRAIWRHLRRSLATGRRASTAALGASAAAPWESIAAKPATGESIAAKPATADAHAGDSTPQERPRGVGEIAHLMVDPALQRSGAGRALVNQMVQLAREAGLSKLVLVTPPDLGARNFYEALGWIPGDVVVSRSGERFVSYSLGLSDRPT